MNNWYSQTKDEISSFLGTSSVSLTGFKAETILKEVEPNKLEVQKSRIPFIRKYILQLIFKLMSPTLNTNKYY